MVGEFLLAVGDGGLAVGVKAEDALVAVAEAGEDGVEFLSGRGGVGWHCFFFLVSGLGWRVVCCGEVSEVIWLRLMVFLAIGMEGCEVG